MAAFKSLVTAVLLPVLVQSQFVPAPTDLTSTTGYLDIPVRYKEVPDGICEMTPGVKSYAGYSDIEPAQVSIPSLRLAALGMAYTRTAHLLVVLRGGTKSHRSRSEDSSS